MTPSPSPASVAQADQIIRQSRRLTYDVALALDAERQAGARETWEAAAKRLIQAATTPALVTDAYNIAVVAEIRAMLHAIAEGFRTRAEAMASEAPHE